MLGRTFGDMIPRSLTIDCDTLLAPWMVTRTFLIWTAKKCLSVTHAHFCAKYILRYYISVNFTVHHIKYVCLP